MSSSHQFISDDVEKPHQKSKNSLIKNSFVDQKFSDKIEKCKFLYQSFVKIFKFFDLTFLIFEPSD